MPYDPENTLKRNENICPYRLLNMDIQTALLIIVNRMLLHNEREWSSDPHYHMNEVWILCWVKESIQKDHSIVWYNLQAVLFISDFIGANSSTCLTFICNSKTNTQALSWSFTDMCRVCKFWVAWHMFSQLRSSKAMLCLLDSGLLQSKVAFHGLVGATFSCFTVLCFC